MTYLIGSAGTIALSIIVAIVAVAGVATFVLLSQEKKDVQFDDSAFNVIGRVNSEGSGLYIDANIIELVVLCEMIQH